LHQISAKVLTTKQMESNLRRIIYAKYFWKSVRRSDLELCIDSESDSWASS